MKGWDLAGVATTLGGLLALVGGELYGVFNDKKNAATVTREWKFADSWLKSHSPVADWLFRVFTIGVLVWTALHFTAGVH
jgi:hypothetical protein